MRTVSAARTTAATSHHRRAPLRIGRIFSYLALFLWSMVVVLPLFWMFSTAFKQQIDMFPSKKYIPFLQFTPKLDAFQYIFTDFSRQMINAYENSIIAAVGSAFLATFIGAMAGYALV